MGEMTDKAKGLANQAAGKIKKVQGDVMNDPAKKAEGAAQDLKGKAQKAKGAVKGALGDKV